jgi:hypothetical protein
LNPLEKEHVMPSFRDVVVLLPGITGSVLARADGKEIWSPSGGALWRAISSLGGSLKDLELDPAGTDHDAGLAAQVEKSGEVGAIRRRRKAHGATLGRARAHGFDPG